MAEDVSDIKAKIQRKLQQSGSAGKTEPQTAPQKVRPFKFQSDDAFREKQEHPQKQCP